MIVQIVLGVGCLVTALLTYIKERDVAKEKHKPYLLALFLIAFVSILFSVYYSIDNQIKENANAALLSRIDTLTTNQRDTLSINLRKTLQIVQLQKQSLDSASTILRKQFELKEAYRKISSLQNVKINQILGGTDSPQLSISANTYSRKGYNVNTGQKDSFEYFIQISFYLSNESSYYLKGVSGQLFASNYPKVRVIRRVNGVKNWFLYNKGEEFPPLWINNDLGTLSPKFGKTAFAFEAPVGDSEYRFNVHIEWENGSYNSAFDLIPNTSTSTDDEEFDPLKYQLEYKEMFTSSPDKGRKVKIKFRSTNNVDPNPN